jgi:prolyl-tRNA synthetase
MRQSQLFTKTRKEAPKDGVSKNAQLLIRAGYIHKEMAGVYSFLPLGLRTLNKVTGIIREEMNTIGGQELSLASLQDKAVWEKTGRWSDEVVDVWFKTKLKNDTEVGLGFTHEEPLTIIMAENIQSYRDLPQYVYQFQTKFRNETRAKSGLMRSREFLMKDLYSFSKDTAEHEEFYEQAKTAYTSIFNRTGIGEKTYLTLASGGSFAKFSHEFQTLTDAGEDTIYICENCELDGKRVAINHEIAHEGIKCPECGGEFRKNDTAVEVGNIFNLGTRFSDALDLQYLNEAGEKKPVVMGSYGIGPGRLMGVIAELLSDDKGLVWPESVSPFAVHLMSLGDKEEVKKEAAGLYAELQEKGIEVLHDDRDLRPGEKFADSDLIGIPWRAVVSEKSMAKNIVELKNRKTGEVTELSRDAFMATMTERKLHV